MKLRLHALGISVMILALVSLGTGAYAAVTYTVKKGDTLWSIAKRFDAPIDDIKRASGISANKPLSLGAQLTISPTKEPSEKEQPRKDQQAISKDARKVRMAISRDAINRFGPRIAKRLELEAKREDSSSKDTHDHGIITNAMTCRGARYVRGGTSMRGFDCSGFTRFVYGKSGVRLPHYSVAQAECGEPVKRTELQPGDLVFFQTHGRRISHVGLYVGEDQFIHASTRRRGVIVSSLSHPYYASRYRGARRVLKKS